DRLSQMRIVQTDIGAVSDSSPDEDVSMDVWMGTDPFYDRFPWFRMVGRAFVYLSNLLHNTSLVHKVAIVNEKGDVQGYLRVRVEPIDEDDKSLATGVRQSARLNFRKEDFLKRYRQSKATQGRNGASSEGYASESDPSDEFDSAFPQHIAKDKEFSFRVTVIEVTGIPEEYTDVFCQFNFLHRHDEAFSTEPARGSTQSKALTFNHVQELRASANPAFVHYLQHFPLIFEVFGHFEKKSPAESLQRPQLSRRMSTKLCFQQPSLVVSTPVKSKKAHSPFMTNPNPVRTKYDLLVWFEICELASSGEYIPAIVDHANGLPTHGIFLLHQGIQRRIKITLCHERGEFDWKDCQELVIGRIRTTPDWCGEDSDVLSLGLFPGTYLEFSMDDRVFFQFEAAWDSSLHNSPLLNRVSNYGEQVYLTLSAYMEMENTPHPAVITKDLSVLVYARDSKISAASRFCRSLIGGISKSPEMNRVPGAYMLSQRELTDS
ncbi:Kinesin-like, partial [Aphelenchoides avenae]